MYVIKLGGSLITHKDKYCSPNRKAIKQYAQEIKKNWTLFKGNLIIILGGGSYGNGVPIRYNLQNSMQEWKPQDLLMMTTKMNEWQTEVCTIFRDEGIPCYPFQGSSYITSNDGNVSSCYIEPIKSALNMELLPILSGDLTFDSEEKFVIFSSDKIPLVLNKELDISRVVMLTDVEGIYYKNSPDQIYEEVTQENFYVVLSETGVSNQQDVTGGMKTKLLALIELAKQGVRGVICDGNDPYNLTVSLLNDNTPGTQIKEWQEQVN
ncbi:Isopentenyl phosphate kinase [Salinibacillus kushneri]|uniref:Isopentenyl phosphate kinase n=1 Tax=Salinibacillus kushneri TaxID=237682 RepID=A0A1I0EVG2_9BACI|nr:isopentenyl phosphate kinase [Salinibacillus kushneri]SET49410.1 Isopentenyl phosphate kinase [Salinibacillus kushneri]